MDPADESFPLLLPQEGKRLVAFQFEFDNESGHTRRVWESDFHLKDSDGKWHDPLLVDSGRAPDAGQVQEAYVDRGDRYL